MGRKWRRSRLTLTTGFILSALVASQASAQHPSVKLIDLEGNPVLNEIERSKAEVGDNCRDDNDLCVVVQDKQGNQVTLYRGTPVSFEKTCAQCHEEIITDIRASHHGAVGLHDMGWMDNHETRGDDTGTKDFVTNKVLKMRYFRTKSHYGGW